MPMARARRPLSSGAGEEVADLGGYLLEDLFQVRGRVSGESKRPIGQLLTTSCWASTATTRKPAASRATPTE